MSVDKFHFPTTAELRAFETGVWFSEVPVTTRVVDLTLIVSDPYGSGVSKHEYAQVATALPLNDLGDRILASRINFQATAEAAAFSAGLDWFGGAFVNIAQCGAEVIIRQKRPDNEDDEMLTYEFATLRLLIANYRANIQPAPASA